MKYLIIIVSLLLTACGYAETNPNLYKGRRIETLNGTKGYIEHVVCSPLTVAGCSYHIRWEPSMQHGSYSERELLRLIKR